jgi:CheY-specific phosphatase CheX
MKNENINEILNSVVCEILEQTAFVFPEPADQEEGINFEGFEYMETTQFYSGDKVGLVKLIVPKEFCKELSENILGEDLEIDKSVGEIADALKEVLNIITGQLLIELYGEEAIFNLTPPQVNELSKEEFFSFIENYEYALALSDNYPVITILSLIPEGEREYTGSGS